jgi:aminoglycoside 3-N-acetyltransferase
VNTPAPPGRIGRPAGPPSFTRRQLTEQLTKLPLTPGRDVIVHSSLRAVGWVVGGPGALRLALRDVLGPEATIVVPTQTTYNSITSTHYLSQISQDMSEADIERIRRAIPPYTRDTPSHGMGVFAEHIRLSPGAVRSPHPKTSFAALGPAAAELNDRHPLHCHLGDQSPLGRLYERGAQILLLGVGYDKCTAFHLAEYRQGAFSPQPRPYQCKVPDPGNPLGRWARFRDIELDDSDFTEIGKSLEYDTDLVRHHEIGIAPSALFPFREAVDYAAAWMGRHRSGAGATAAQYLPAHAAAKLAPSASSLI